MVYLWFTYLSKMVIFQSYVSLPKRITHPFLPSHPFRFVSDAKIPQIHHVNRSKLHFAVIVGRTFAEERIIPTSAVGDSTAETT